MFQLNGQPFENLGLAGASLQLRSFGTSIMRLDIVDADLATTPALNYRADAVISGDGGVIFRGKVAGRGQRRSGASFRQTLEIRDAWWELERTAYKQAWDLATAVSGDVVTHAASSRITLGATPNIDVLGNSGAVRAAGGGYRSYSIKPALLTPFGDNGKLGVMTTADEIRNLIG